MTYPRVPLRRVTYTNTRVLGDDTPADYSFRYIDISQVDCKGSVTVPDEELTFEEAPSRARRIGLPGDVAISTVRTYLRAIGSVPRSQSPLVFSTGFAIVEAGQTLEPRFLRYACREDGFVNEIEARSTGVSYPAISPNELTSVPISLPPMDEQRRIADFLDDRVARIDAISAAREWQFEALDSSMLAIAHAQVTGRERTGGRRDSGIPWAPTLPEDWGAPRVCQVARMGTGHTPSRSEPSYWQDCNLQWLTTGDVHRFRHDEIDAIEETVIQISELGLANSAAVLHPRGTVALSRTASAGFSIVMATEMATSQDFATWTPGPRLSAQYLLWCLRAMRRDLMGRLAMGSTHKTIYFPELMSIRIPLPSVDEQRDIAASMAKRAVEVRRAMVVVTDSIQLLQEYKRSLITAAVTGEFDVTAARMGVPA